MVDFRYLRAFHAIGDSLTLREASEILNISISAVSRQLSLLEESVGAQLFIRGSRKLIFTKAGLKLFESLRKFEEELSLGTDSSPIRIGCLQSVFEFFFVKFMKKHKNIFSEALDIEINSPEALSEGLRGGRLDLAITSLSPPKESQYSAIRLFGEKIDWVRPEKVERPIIFSAFEINYENEHLNRDDRIRVNSFNSAISLVDHGFGNALVAKPTRATQSSAKQFQQIYAVMPKFQQAPERLLEIFEALRKAEY